MHKNNQPLRILEKKEKSLVVNQ